MRGCLGSRYDVLLDVLEEVGEMALGDLGKRIKDSVKGIVSGAGDVVEGTVDTVRSAVAGTLRGAADVTKAAAGAAADAVTGGVGGRGRRW